MSFYSTPTSFNPLGEVSEGSLKIRARTIPLYRQLEKSASRLQRSPFDEITSLEPSDERVLCVNICSISHGYLGERPSASRQCLLLFPLGPGQDVYRRLGYLDVPIPDPPQLVIFAGVELNKDMSFLTGPLMTASHLMRDGRRKRSLLCKLWADFTVPFSLFARNYFISVHYN